LDDGQFLELAGLAWQVLETPGHASGHLCLYAPETGWLISGDVVWDADFGVLTTRIEGWDAPLRLRDSLLRLSELKVTKVFPGHGPPLEDGPRAVAGCLERAEGFLRHPRRLGQDQVRKILLYHLMMKGPLERGALWELEQGLPWLGEVCQQFFDGQLEATFNRHLDELIERGLARLEGGLLASTLDA
jgi:glyoxylase-like metal-dependent hydrolase (beta-lactamase superfamily II)